MTADTSKSLDLHAHPEVGASPAASKDAPTAEVVKAAMARVLDPGEDMPVNDPWPFNVLLDAYVGLRADGLALAAHVAALTAQLEAERATGDETARHISRLLDHLARETARADAAEAEAKDAMLANAALREALKEVLSWHDYTDDMHKPVEVRAAYMRARATLAQSRSDSECDLPAADGGGFKPSAECIAEIEQIHRGQAEAAKAYLANPGAYLVGKDGGQP